MKPLGIMPRIIWDQQRLYNLKQAIKRYRNADLEPKLEWINEYYEILQRHGLESDLFE